MGLVPPEGLSNKKTHTRLCCRGKWPLTSKSSNSSASTSKPSSGMSAKSLGCHPSGATPVRFLKVRASCRSLSGLSLSHGSLSAAVLGGPVP